MSTEKKTIEAGKSFPFHREGDFFRLMNCANAVTITFFKSGREVTKAVDVMSGYANKKGAPFDYVEVYSATTQEVVIDISSGDEVSYDRMAGSVDLLNQGRAFVHSAPVVTNASSVMLAANSARRYLFIQNNDPTGVVWIRTDGAGATAAPPCIKIGPGGHHLLDSIVPIGAITAIGDLASNANVTAIEA